MANATLTLEVHVLDVEAGVWCHRCNLPSAVKVHCAIVGATSLRILGRLDRTCCQDCGTVEQG